MARRSLKQLLGLEARAEEAQAILDIADHRKAAVAGQRLTGKPKKPSKAKTRARKKGKVAKQARKRNR